MAQPQILHPMSQNIQQIRETLLATSPDWLVDYNHPKRYPKANGVCKKTYRFELACLGANFASKLSDAYQDQAIFTCVYSKCDASVIVHGQKNSFETMQKNDEMSFQWDIEMSTVHINQCAISVRQVKVLRYLLALKQYLSDPNNRNLKSNVGLYLCHEISAEYSDVTVIATMDHLIETKSKKTTDNCLYCIGCYRPVTKVSRDIATCTLVSNSGEHSVQLNPSRFAFSEDDNIPDFEKPCTNPMYMYNRKNVLANGLVTVIPQLASVVFALKWQALFDKFTIVSEEEINTQMDEIAHISGALVETELREQELYQTQMEAIANLPMNLFKDNDEDEDSQRKEMEAIANFPF